jgi:hypothetical protein
MPMRPSAVFAILSLLPLAAVADVYRSVDAQGHVLYSDTPTPGAERIRSSGTDHLIGAATPTPAARPAPAAKANPPPDATRQAEVARAVQSDVQQNRAEQCKKARDAYQKSVQARRIYNDGPDGERQYLTDDEAEKVRVNNKLAVDELCKDSDAGTTQQ